MGLTPWKYKNKNINSTADLPDSAVGFIYLIEGENGKKYIGKKSLYSVRNPEISKAVYDRLRKEGEPVTKTKNKAKSKKGKIVWRYKRKQVKTDTNWKDYYGSSDVLKKEVKNGLKIKRKIIHVCFSKKELSYYENKELFVNEVIEKPNEYYNSNIMGKFFPKDLENK